MDKLSINLGKLLRNANISENELARRTGIAQQIINRILSGENKNPKLSTLNPLANYFMISISQLIGDELIDDRKNAQLYHLVGHEIPIIDYKLLEIKSINELLTQKNEKILVDSSLSGATIFAVRMHGDSMDPKFPEGTILIFEHNKEALNGDFL